MTAETYRELAESAWRWVLTQVRWDDGPWIPESITEPAPTADRNGLYAGVGGLAHVLAEIRLTRPWTAEEKELADAITAQVTAAIPAEQGATFFDGLVSSLGVLTALEAPGADAAVSRLEELATPTGWPQAIVGPPRYLPEARINDLTLGTAGVLLGALWARRHGVEAATGLAERAATVLLAEGDDLPTGTNWLFVSARYRTDAGTQMPNLSHGVAGIAATLALAGSELGRPDLVEASRRGAEHLVSLGVRGGDGFVVPRYIPSDVNDEDEFTYTWCHGASGTSLLFLALDHAGVETIAGESPLTWHRRLLHSVRSSGLPERRYPGFWDNDGRCCGTAGVGDIFLDSWDRARDPVDLEFTLRLADALVERAMREDSYAYWRFVEHRADDPLLPPGIGWMQGAAGIAAYLFRIARVCAAPADAVSLPRMETWWAVSGARPQPS
ncbi:lanthionine synthetase-like protein [Kribbella amoyensis]|uniref:Lanthionine synthetase-like protein n=1 Tax=Kribbella amoyensis TaxID=996641 RepID=A0A561BSL9_9ACTN|nr:lanthionine synthetase LanC family protein [Kribbella amoyensis]TWD81846.1 lanthionine synthetase-like protein [Kribbella amoyensis]